jgi:hypothetical protein
LFTRARDLTCRTGPKGLSSGRQPIRNGLNYLREQAVWSGVRSGLPLDPFPPRTGTFREQFMNWRRGADLEIRASR